MNYRRKIKRLITVLFNSTIYPLSGLAPRSSRQWIFGNTGGAFAGNPKYLYLWISIHRPDLRATWLTPNESTRRLLAGQGFRVRRRGTFLGMIAALRAKVYVSSHGVASINLRLSRGCFFLNLWHGVGLKAVHFGHAGGRTTLARKEAATWFGRIYNLTYLRQPDALVTTSDLMQAHFSSQFDLPPELCPQLGYPRLDCAADPALARVAQEIDAAAGFVLNPGGYSEIYVYLPTFRDTGRPFFAEALPDLDRLSRVLNSRNALLYVKPHLRTEERLSAAYANIRAWPDAIDFNTYLTAFTGLITDYSSVLYDYLYLRASGVLLYTFDFEEYSAKDRALLFPFADNIAGVRVSTFDALCDAIGDGSASAVVPAEDLAKIRERFWGGSASPASPAIVEYVEGRLGLRASLVS